MIGTASIIRGNALDLPIADSSVDLIVTSPPYFGLRSYQDGGEHYDGQIGDEATPAEFADALVAATAEMVRVLKPSGSIWVNLGDKYVADNRGSGSDPKRGGAKWAPAGSRGYVGEGIMPRKSLMGIPWRYALRCIDDLGLILRAEVIWSKPNAMPDSARDRVGRSHEHWFHFTTGPRYFADVEVLRQEPAGYTRKGGAATYTANGHASHGVGSSTLHQMNPLGRLPGSVWTIPTQPLTVPDHLGIDHFAAFPMEWPRRIIRGWSPEGSFVLDPFGGTGTTALVAKALGRHGISNDMSFDYCRLATWRTNDEAELARAMQVEKPAEQVRGQASLLDLIGEASA